MMANEFLRLASRDKYSKCFKVAELYKPEMADHIDNVSATFTDDELGLSLDEFSSKFLEIIKTILLEAIHLHRDDSEILVFYIERDGVDKSKFVRRKYKNFIINIEKQYSVSLDKDVYAFMISYKKLSNPQELDYI